MSVKNRLQFPVLPLATGSHCSRRHWWTTTSSFPRFHLPPPKALLFSITPGALNCQSKWIVQHFPVITVFEQQWILNQSKIVTIFLFDAFSNCNNGERRSQSRNKGRPSSAQVSPKFSITRTHQLLLQFSQSVLDPNGLVNHLTFISPVFTSLWFLVRFAQSMRIFPLPAKVSKTQFGPYLAPSKKSPKIHQHGPSTAILRTHAPMQTP